MDVQLLEAFGQGYRSEEFDSDQGQLRDTSWQDWELKLSVQDSNRVHIGRERLKLSEIVSPVEDEKDFRNRSFHLVWTETLA